MIDGARDRGLPTRSQRAHSVLTLFAADFGAHNLVCGKVDISVDISKATQNREIIEFCDCGKTILTFGLSIVY